MPQGSDTQGINRAGSTWEKLCKDMGSLTSPPTPPPSLSLVAPKYITAAQSLICHSPRVHLDLRLSFPEPPGSHLPKRKDNVPRKACGEDNIGDRAKYSAGRRRGVELRMLFPLSVSRIPLHALSSALLPSAGCCPSSPASSISLQGQVQL